MRIQFVLSLLLALPLTAAAQGADPNLGRNLAATCAGCHNISGKAVTGMPPIAGRSKDVLLKMVRA